MPKWLHPHHQQKSIWYFLTLAVIHRQEYGIYSFCCDFNFWAGDRVWGGAFCSVVQLNVAGWPCGPHCGCCLGPHCEWGLDLSSGLGLGKLLGSF